MTEDEFRIDHSRLIENYQYIEMRLKGICAAMLADEEKNWFERLGDYSEDTLGKLIRNIQTIQSEKNCALFTQDNFESLEQIRKARNYWCHECFGGDWPIIFKRGKVMRQAHVERLLQDLRESAECEEKLVEIMRSLHDYTE